MYWSDWLPAKYILLLFSYIWVSSYLMWKWPNLYYSLLKTQNITIINIIYQFLSFYFLTYFTTIIFFLNYLSIYLSIYISLQKIPFYILFIIISVHVLASYRISAGECMIQAFVWFWPLTLIYI